MGPAGRRGRRRGLIVGAAVGSAAARRNAANEPAQAVPNSNSDDQFAQLEKLGKLRDEGILTQAEFDAKKSQILGL